MSGLVPQDPAEAAFEALRGEVALLRRAVEALATRPDPIDHGPAVAKLTEEILELTDQVVELAGRPKLTVGELRDLVADVANDSVRAPKDAMWKAQALIVDVSARLVTVAGVLRDRKVQNRRLWRVGVASAVSAVIVWTALAGPVARLAPSRWGWAERMAAASLAMPMWQAGERLMRRADEAKWRAQAQALATAEGSRAALSDCARRAAAHGRAVTCEIKVAPSPKL